MSVTLSGMTLRTLLETYGVTRIKKLCEDLHISRQYGWNLWHGSQGIGPVMIQKLHATYDIPLEDLMCLNPVAPRKPRGRPRKTREDRNSE